MYCTIDNILKDIQEDELIRLADDENRAHLVDLTNTADPATARILEQIEAADDEIDGYLRSSYNLPFTSVPERIKQISKDISIYNLYKRRFRLEMPETLTAIYNKRLQELKDIQRGVIKLDVEVDEGTPQPSEIKVNKTADDKVFNNLDKF